MAKDLTSARTIRSRTTNAQTGAVTTTYDRHLASVAGNGGTHLAVVRKTAAWSGKTLVATPKSNLFAFAFAYDGDTQSLLDAMGAALDGAALGGSSVSALRQKALFSWCGTCNDPGFAHDGGTGTAVGGVGQSFLLMKFNLRGLPLGAMSEWHAYLRFHNLSAVAAANDGGHNDYADPDSGRDIGVLAGSSAARQALVYADVAPAATVGRFTDGAKSETLTIGSDKWNGNVHPGTGVYESSCAAYLPFGEERTINPLRVYRPTVGGTTPVHRTSDVELTGDVKDFILRHTLAPFWLGVRFNRAAVSGVFVADHTEFFYAQHIDLVLVCTGGRFNA